MNDALVVKKELLWDAILMVVFVVVIILSIVTLVLGVVNLGYAAGGAVGFIGNWERTMGLLQLVTAVALIGPVGITLAAVPLGPWPKVLVVASFVLAAAHGLSAVLGWAIPSFGPFWTPILHLVFVVVYWYKLD